MRDIAIATRVFLRARAAVAAVNLYRVHFSIFFLVFLLLHSRGRNQMESTSEKKQKALVFSRLLHSFFCSIIR